jgi:hypothetical protein
MIDAQDVKDVGSAVLLFAVASIVGILTAVWMAGGFS